MVQEKQLLLVRLQKNLDLQNKSVILAASDTFRAAAVEQLKTWGQKSWSTSCFWRQMVEIQRQLHFKLFN